MDTNMNQDKAEFDDQINNMEERGNAPLSSGENKTSLEPVNNHAGSAVGGDSAIHYQGSDSNGHLRELDNGVGSPQRATQPGVFSVERVVVRGASERLSQMEKDVIAKQQNASYHTSTTQPGAVSIPGGTGHGSSVSDELAQMERNILRKQIGDASLSSKSQPGIVDSLGGSHGNVLGMDQLSQMEKDILAKKLGGSSHSSTVRPGAMSIPGGSTASANLNQMEQDILAKQNGAGPSALRPGAVSVVGGGTVRNETTNSALSQMEQDVLAKQRGTGPAASRPGAMNVPPSSSTFQSEVSGELNQMEQDILAKQAMSRPGAATSMPGAISVNANSEGQLSQMEHQILEKQRQYAPKSITDNSGTIAAGDQRSQMELSSHGSAPPSGSLMGRTQGAIIAIDDTFDRTLSQMENDILTKQRESAGYAPTRPGAVAVSAGSAGAQLNQLEQDMLAKQRSASLKPAASPNERLSKTEHDILAKQGGNTGLSMPGAVSVSAAGQLTQMEHQILAKQLDMPPRSVNSQQGWNNSLSQTEQDILSKQQASMGSQASRPGAHVVGAGQLTQMERDILAKQQVATSTTQGGLSQVEQDILVKQRARMTGGTPHTTSVFATSGELSRMEQDVLTKQLARPAGTDAGRLGPTQIPQDVLSKQRARVSDVSQLTQMEQDILAKQNAAGPINGPFVVGAVSSSRTALSQMEQDILSKENARSTHSTVEDSAGQRLSQVEQDLMLKQRQGGQATSVPGAVASSGHELSQMERNILAKQGGGGDQSLGVSGASPMALDALSRQSLLESGSAVSTIAQFEADVAAKNMARAASLPSANGAYGGLMEMENDLRSKARDHSFVAPSAPGSVNSQPLYGGLNDLTNEINAKSIGPSPHGYNPNAREGSGDPTSSLHVLEVEIRNKNQAPALSQHNVSQLDQDGQRRHQDYNMQPGFDREYGQGGRQSFVQPGYDFEYQRRSHQGYGQTEYDNTYGNGGRQDYGQPEYDHAYGQGGRQDYARPDYDYEYARSLQQHELNQSSHLDLPQPIDAGLPPSMGEGVDFVPHPLSIPYTSSDEPEVPHSGDGDSYDDVPNVDVPEGGIEAYVPPTVVEAAGVAVVMSTEEEERLDKEKKKRYALGGAICVCLVAISIIVPTVLTAAGGSSPDPVELPPSMAPSYAPSAAPSFAPTSSAFADFLEDVIKPLKASPDAVFDDVNSPQYQAALWLVEEDSKTYWPQSELSPSDSKVIQRYALATFHYATDGNKWRLCGKESPNCPRVAWLSPVDECTWHFVSCDDIDFVEMLDFQTEENTNAMHGPLPRELSLLAGLKRFIAPFNQLEGDLDDPFHGLTLLDTIVLDHNKINGTIPADVVEQNPNLGVLNVGFNEMTGTLPQSLAASKLSHLQLQNNRFVGTIPEDIGQSTRLQVLDLQNNMLEGPIPPSLYELAALSVFSITNNTEVFGSLESRIGLLKMLTRIEAENTGMMGSIPPELYQLTLLTDIVFSNSKMTGPLTEDIRLLNSTLKILNLQQNTFTGPLPQALDTLTALTKLLLNENEFTGTISDKVCDERGIGFQKLFVLQADCNIVCSCNDFCTR